MASLQLAVIALGTVMMTAQAACPPWACQNIRCPPVDEVSCYETGYVHPSGGHCGCCPACIKLLAERESCHATPLLGGVRPYECGAGLYCHASAGLHGQCVPEKCADKPECQMYCNYGFEISDETGCPTCSCAAIRIEEPESEYPEHCANRPLCMKWCDYGFKTDESGCPICSCRGPPSGPLLGGRKKRSAGACEIESPSRECGKRCVFGYKFDLETDCYTCECNKCPRGTCRMLCQYGFEEDARGCTRCKCKSAP